MPIIMIRANYIINNTLDSILIYNKYLMCKEIENTALFSGPGRYN